MAQPAVPGEREDVRLCLRLQPEADCSPEGCTGCSVRPSACPILGTSLQTRLDHRVTLECQDVGGRLVPTDQADRHGRFDVDQLPVNTIARQVARIRDAFLRARTDLPNVTEPSGRRWLEISEDAVERVTQRGNRCASEAILEVPIART